MHARVETVTFYRNDGGRPGAVISTQTVVGDEEGHYGTFEIPLDTVRLKAGRRYWISAQGNMDFVSTSGQWGRENTAVQRHRPALWMNPGGGFGTDCFDWSNMQACLGGVASGADFMFELLGTRPPG